MMNSLRRRPLQEANCVMGRKAASLAMGVRMYAQPVEPLLGKRQYALYNGVSRA